MFYCSNCGEKLDSGAKFCSKCGVNVNMGTSANSTQRRQEYVGKIFKCPACGTDTPSFTAICSVCGHEMNSAQVSSSLRDFINRIEECDRLIANNPDPPRTGWASWKGSKRFWWIVLNIYLICIPLIIYLILPLLRYNKAPLLSADEKRKASLIENFAFPNDRESILEALLFIKSKMVFLSSEKVDKQTAYWGRLWFIKADQLHQKAEIVLQSDPVAKSAYIDIVSSNNKIKSAVKIKTIIGVMILVVLIFFLYIVSLNSPDNFSNSKRFIPKPDILVCNVYTK